MGGPMAVYEMDLHPFLMDEAEIIGQFIGSDRHVLGICLGAQLVAHVLGSRVYPGGEKEIGWYRVAISPEGMADPFLSALSLDGRACAEVFQWHGDTFDLPERAVRLASSDLFPNQAFRYSDRVYGLQFHVEVTPAIVAGWLEHQEGLDLQGINAESRRIVTPYGQRAVRSYRSFFAAR
jgi:GMP synthase (glutamine-hydrolysing)